jgi:hypothetical protein
MLVTYVHTRPKHIAHIFVRKLSITSTEIGENYCNGSVKFMSGKTVEPCWTTMPDTKPGQHIQGAHLLCNHLCLGALSLPRVGMPAASVHQDCPCSAAKTQPNRGTLSQTLASHLLTDCIPSCSQEGFM